MSKKKKIIIWIIIAVVIIGGVFLYFKTKKTEVERVTEAVKIGNVARTVSVTGEITPEKQADLAFETIGKIKSIEVEIGDEVEEGQIIAALDDSVVRSQLWSAQVALDIQQENLDLSRRKWDDLKPEEKAAKKLGENIIIPYGSDKEKEIAEYIANKTHAKVLPKMNLDELKAAISHCDLVIGNDTGPTYIAWANNIPSVIIYGPVEANKVYENKYTKFIKSTPNTNPIKINKNDFSIKKISYKEILDAVEKL
jgi:hypothetical protein